MPVELVKLGLWVAREYCSTPARGLALVLPPGTGTGGRRVGAKRRLVATLAAAAEEPDRLGSRQRAVLEALADGPLPVASLPADHSTLRRLEARGLVTAVERDHQPPARRDRGGRAVRGRGAHRRSAGSRARGRGGTRRGGSAEPLLLHGVTGSGKTEVYLRAAAAALERGRSAIVLVPEIALTPQTAARFVERFGDAVAILHSRLTARERYDEWARLRAGEARVCVGPRSAVFAPVERLGLIVIDEEHDALLQAGGRPALRRSLRGREARGGGRRRAAGGERDPPAGEPAALPAAGAARAHRRTRSARGGAAGRARARARCTSARSRPSTESGSEARRRSSC